MARKVNKTNPRNVAKPVSQLRGAAKQARIAKVTKAEAGPQTIRGGMAPGAGRSKPIGTGGGGVTKPSGTPKMVNANKPVMRQIQAKADALRQRTQNPTPRGQGKPITMPNSKARGVNLPKVGAGVERRMAAGTMSPGRTAQMAERGKQAVKAAQAKRGAKQAMKSMEGTLRAARAARQIAGGVKSLTRGGAAAGLQAYNTAPGTLTAAKKRGDYVPSKFASARAQAFAKAKAIKGSPVVGPKKPIAQQFDNAFKAARTAGKSSFTFRGKTYNTKTK